MEKRYCSLHQHSDASFLDAMIPPEKLAERAAAVGMKAVALTDHGNLHNFVRMYEACKKHGIKFIPGCEFYFTHDHEAKERKSRHLTVLAMNNKGLSNLYKMTTWANMPPDKKGGFYYRPRISWKELENYHEGLIILSGCMNSPVNAEFGFNEDYDAGKEHAQHLKDIFGRDRFFIEIQNVNENGKIYIPEQEIILEWSRRLASELNLKKVATNDCHYLLKNDKFAHEVLKAIDARATLQTPIVDQAKGIKRGRLVFNGEDYYVKSDEEMRTKFTQDEVDTSAEIADMVDVDIDIGANHMPLFRGLSDDECYEKMLVQCREGWKKLDISSKTNSDEYLDRLHLELEEIKDARLQHYFMIVWDVCRFCHDNSIGMGYGRGSCAGSLILYLLGITRKADPIRYGLIWERFWNHGRKGSMPDIDLDIQIDRREEVIDYLRNEFGRDKVFPMMTMTTMTAKGVLKDVGKVMGLEFDYMNRLTKLVPHKNKGLQDSIDRVEEIALAQEGIDEDTVRWAEEIKEPKEESEPPEILRRKIAEREKALKRTFEVAFTLENIARQRSTHACAILLSDQPVFGVIPTCWDNKKKAVLTGFDMYDMDKLGFMKLDCLGLKTISVCETIMPGFVDNMPGDFDDPEVLKLISSGRSKGVFQLESKLGIKWAKKQKPENILDIAALVSIIRPAVLEAGLADQYISNRNSPNPPDYIHKDLEPILNSSNGVMLYQEQAIRITRDFADFSLQRADNLRRVLGKKLEKELPQFEAEFKDGVVEKHNNEDLGDQLWSWLEHGAGYGFNLSHALTYGMLAYATAYMKKYHPKEFFCTMLQFAENEQRPQEEIAELFYDAKLFGVPILPPSIKQGNKDFELIDNKIYYGLNKIKHIGKSSINKFMKKNSKYDTWRDIISNLKLFKKDVLSALIFSGAFDEYEMTRGEMQRQTELLGEFTDRELQIWGHIYNEDPPPEFKGGKIVDLSNSDEMIEVYESGEQFDCEPPSFRDSVDTFYRYMTGDNVTQKVISSRRAATVTQSLGKFLATDPKSDVSLREKAGKETYFLGVPITCCEVDIYKDPRKTHDILQTEREMINKGVSTIGIVSRITERTDKKGNKMCFVSLQDRGFMIDAVMFSDVYTNYGSKLEAGKVIYVEGMKNKTGSFQIKAVESL